MAASDGGVEAAAELFRVLGSPARLRLLRGIAEQPVQVSVLAETVGMTQPLVSQHLRVLRQASIVTAVRSGREVLYRLTDQHIAHVVEDAVAHTLEDREQHQPLEEETMSITDTHAEHSLAEHEHGADCGHPALQHGEHVDYVHGTHHHALHGEHYDEHESVAEHTPDAHTHGDACGHDAVEHDDHVDYVHDGHRHAAHAGHYDEH